jgi:glucosamine 6-phosphate synthetase-like amidotransferase/phosphosugar isomerase protein
LKLKEISYIHAESYAAGELKHGPLAIVDENMPVLAVAPNNVVLEKLKSNLEEVKQEVENYIYLQIKKQALKTMIYHKFLK